MKFWSHFSKSEYGFFAFFSVLACSTCAIGSHNHFTTANFGSNPGSPSARDNERADQGTIKAAPKLKCLTSSYRRTIDKQPPIPDRRGGRPEMWSKKKGKRDVHQSETPGIAPGVGTGGDGNNIADVVYFDTGADVLYYRHLHATNASGFPAERFSVEMWIKPEGGQHQDAVIVELSDKCRNGGDWGWSVGISSEESGDESDARFYFKVKTDRSAESTVIRANRAYTANKWAHLVATYDGHHMKMYLNSALISQNDRQSGPVFAPITYPCKQLTVGGSDVKEAQFRGMVDKIALDSSVISHGDIALSFKNRTRFAEMDHLLYDEFTDLDNWEVFHDLPPLLMRATIPSENLELEVPECGMTICDNEDLILKYHTEPSLSVEKRLKYRYITVTEDNGTDPLVSLAEINRQHRLVKEAFRPHNLSWDFNVHLVNDSSLRRKEVLISCREEQIGNGICNEECNYDITGSDGGDCDPHALSCVHGMIGDGICHIACNVARHEYDGGDCCDPERADISLCQDPTSPERAYISLNRYKEIIGLDSYTYLNVFLVPVVELDVMGLASYPWHSESLTLYGGCVVAIGALSSKSSNNTIIHELGHSLGLWHTHRGVSEVSCSDKCRETHPSFSSGDLVQDTDPTPENHRCHDPVYGEYGICGLDRAIFKDTPFRNYMGYGDSACVDEFTPQQAARMHCYIDLKYSSWRDVRLRSVKPVMPFSSTVVRSSGNATNGGVTLSWYPPLGETSRNRERCSVCKTDGSLTMYATSAFFYDGGRMVDAMAFYVTGPPDTEKCNKDTRVWYPSYPDVFPCDDCYMELEFDFPIHATRISIWVTHARRIYMSMKLQLILEDGTILPMSTIHASCDTPYTKTLDIPGRIERVRLYKLPQFGHIDGVLLESAPGQPNCRGCATLYALERQPHFTAGQIIKLTDSRFTDIALEGGRSYSYRIIPVSRGEAGKPSSPTEYHIGKGFCGDGVTNISIEEQCDDGNIFSGDGCSSQCREEEDFICEGEPSLCRYYRGDGQCESHELTVGYSPMDCAHVTPNGFSDQWATKTIVPMENTTTCDPLKLLGPVANRKTCQTFREESDFEKETPLSLEDAWVPCRGRHRVGLNSIEVSFENQVIATSIILHLAAVLDNHTLPIKVTIELMDAERFIHTRAADRKILQCEDNPVHIGVHQDLSTPFHYTKHVRLTFTGQHVALNGIRLRSSLHLNPLALAACDIGTLYNPVTQRCTDYRPYMPRCREDINIRHGNTTCTGYSEGDICTVKCDHGYRPLEEMKLHCSNETWQNLEHALCTSVECAEPSMENTELTCLNNQRTYGERCKISCENAMLKGDSNEIVCQADGLFSLPQSTCQVFCSAPTNPSHAELLTKQCNKKQLVGTQCKFRCSPGYETTSAPVPIVSSKVFFHRCSHDLTWVGPSCQRVRCPAIPVEFEGFYSCSDDLFYESKCTMRCPTDIQLITCTDQGVWSSPFHPC